METQLYFFWSGISMAIFYFFYLVVLNRETFFQVNRIYLLSALFLSIVIPLLDLSQFATLPTIELMVSTLSVIAGRKQEILVEKELDWISAIYWIGVLFTATLLLVKLFVVKRYLKLPQSGSAFSFWRTKVIDPLLTDFETIDAHENVHIIQLHTLDMLLIEVISVIFWFNPLVYFYRRSLRLIHEYLADDYAANLTGSKKQYAMVLFLHNFKAGPFLTNTFYNSSLLEARIKMLQRKKSHVYRLWKYAACIPLLFFITVLCSFSTSNFGSGIPRVIDTVATFPGGPEAFSDYLVATLKKASTKNGSVLVSFVIEANGRVSGEKIEKGLDYISDGEALRVIGSSPKWKPALQNGKRVRSGYQIGINFEH